jgi:hypothetical protein
VKGLDIAGFSADGIDLLTNGGDTIAANYIGTDITGTVAAANGGAGVYIALAADLHNGAVVDARKGHVLAADGAGDGGRSRIVGRRRRRLPSAPATPSSFPGRRVARITRQLWPARGTLALG